MESERLKGVYILPEGVTFTDIQRVHEELLASEGLDLRSIFEDFVEKAKRDGKHEAAEKETASSEVS
jgi:hypothetical protein